MQLKQAVNLHKYMYVSKMYALPLTPRSSTITKECLLQTMIKYKRKISYQLTQMGFLTIRKKHFVMCWNRNQGLHTSAVWDPLMGLYTEFHMPFFSAFLENNDKKDLNIMKKISQRRKCPNFV